jgi:hypothetical protein
VEEEHYGVEESNVIDLNKNNIDVEDKLEAEEGVEDEVEEMIPSPLRYGLDLFLRRTHHHQELLGPRRTRNTSYP